jgi:signal transduction histidine kinase
VKSRTWPILGIGFGTLVVLIGFLGIDATRRAEEIYRQIQAAHQSYLRSEQILNDLRASIAQSGILVRDFLLDPSHLTADRHRTELLQVRSSMMQDLDELDRLMGSAEPALRQRLRAELDGYWKSREPIFTWTPQQKMALSYLYLQREVRPRRNAVLSIADEVAALRDANFRSQQRKISQSREEFRRHQSKMLAVAFALGLAVAIASMLRISRLEGRAEEQRRRTEHAEQELRRLSQQLVKAQEEERKSISRELHDQVGQMLTALRMELGDLEQLNAGAGEKFQAGVRETKRLAEQTMHLVRDLAMGLRPSMLDDLGLAPALEWQAREFSRRSGVPVDLEMDGALDKLPDNHRACVYRVVQETLTNCARHAHAKHVRVAIHGSESQLSLAIQDDGKGFAPEDRSGGLGLIGIEERVRELGGSVAIFSQPQKGTLIRVGIPLPQEAVS